jgi:hypothetical protein
MNSPEVAAAATQVSNGTNAATVSSCCRGSTAITAVGTSRNNMDVRVHHRLARRASIIQADVERFDAEPGVSSARAQETVFHGDS